MGNANTILTGVAALVILLFGLAFWAIFAGGDRMALPGELPEGRIAAGRDLALTNCAACHDVTGAGPSPQAEAPPFTELAQRWPVEYLAESFAEGIAVQHHDSVQMPEFEFEPEQIDDLLAYLESLG